MEAEGEEEDGADFLWEGGGMTDHCALQAAYAAKRQAHAAGVHVVTRPIRRIGDVAMDNPPRITFRADMEAETRAKMALAGFEFADEPPGRGNFF